MSKSGFRKKYNNPASNRTARDFTNNYNRYNRKSIQPPQLTIKERSNLRDKREELKRDYLILKKILSSEHDISIDNEILGKLENICQSVNSITDKLQDDFNLTMIEGDFSISPKKSQSFLKENNTLVEKPSAIDKDKRNLN